MAKEMKELKLENERMRIDLAAKDRELARKDNMDMETRRISGLTEDQLKKLEKSCSQLDTKNAEYSVENNTLRRQIDDLR